MLVYVVRYLSQPLHMCVRSLSVYFLWESLMLCLHVNCTHFSYNAIVYHLFLSKSTHFIRAFHCFIIQMYLAALHPLTFFFILVYTFGKHPPPLFTLLCLNSKLPPVMHVEKDRFGLAVGWVRLMTCSKCLTPSQATKAKLLNGNVMRFKASAAAVRVEFPGNRAIKNPTVRHMRPNRI